METYHRFEVPYKTSGSKAIVFHAMGDVNNRSVLEVQEKRRRESTFAQKSIDAPKVCSI